METKSCSLEDLVGLKNDKNKKTLQIDLNILIVVAGRSSTCPKFLIFRRNGDQISLPTHWDVWKKKIILIDTKPDQGHIPTTSRWDINFFKKVYFTSSFSWFFICPTRHKIYKSSFSHTLAQGEIKSTMTMHQ